MLEAGDMASSLSFFATQFLKLAIIHQLQKDRTKPRQDHLGTNSVTHAVKEQHIAKDDCTSW